MFGKGVLRELFGTIIKVVGGRRLEKTA